MEIHLKQSWELGEQIGDGGFGRVFAAASAGCRPCVAKLVPKDKGAERELLFVDMANVRNVVPVVDSGENDGHWVLVMPRAEYSLRDQLDSNGVCVDRATNVMKDVACALIDLNGRVVHRDIKPENTLWLDGHWCLADFGISRYAEATTAPDTQKHALTPAYAAPERWRSERASPATDVYSLGVMAYEALSGNTPFAGTIEDLREAHLHGKPNPLEGVSPGLSALVEACLYKAAGSRPSAEDFLKGLESEDQSASEQKSSGLARLKEINLRQVNRRSEAEKEASARQSAADRRAELAESAKQAFDGFATKMHEDIGSSASAAQTTLSPTGGVIRLDQAELSMALSPAPEMDRWLRSMPPFEVILQAQIAVSGPRQNNYQGRSHSLWYCDAHEKGRFHWFETAFMFTPLLPSIVAIDPFALAPGAESASALGRGLATYQVAWPFVPLALNTFSDFVDRWATWFGDAVNRQLAHPSPMPERHAEGTWRQD